MEYGIRETAAATDEPVTLAELRAHCRVDSADEDQLLSALITAARQYCEEHTGLALVATTYTATFDAFPTGSESIYLPRGPSVDDAAQSVSYVDPAGATQVIAPGQLNWRHDVDPGEVWPLDVWPTTKTQKAAVSVSFRTAGTPRQLAKQAVLLIAAAWFENREEISAVKPTEIPIGARRILDLLLQNEIWVD